MTFDSQDTVVRDSTLMTAPLDGDLVVLSMTTNHYVCFDAVGVRIWELLATPRTVASLCEQLASEFAGSREAIGEDVRAFLETLREEGVLAPTGAQAIL